MSSSWLKLTCEGSLSKLQDAIEHVSCLLPLLQLAAACYFRLLQRLRTPHCRCQRRHGLH